ncbi:Putative ribonuclease H protein At1g65750 [Linum perenne]
MLVSDAVSVDGSWNSYFLLQVLPREIVMQVIGMSPPKENLGRDSMVWGLEPNGIFSVRSAFQLLQGLAAAPQKTIWKRVWGWQGPNKIKHFLWLASHDRLLTNVDRSRRHLTNQVVCPRCYAQAENLQHIFLDCPFALQVWNSVLPSAIRNRSKYVEFGSWWEAMLEDKQFNTKFAVTAWLLWSVRNKLIFDKLLQPVSVIVKQCNYWTDLLLSIWKTNQLGREAPGLARQTHLIAWRPGDEDWSTLNTDGSRLSLNGSTAIGGLICNHHGRFVRAFCANVGDCSITRAKLPGIVEGLKLAWELGTRKISVQTDSRAVISILEHDMQMVRQHAVLVADFHELRSRNWEISLSHVYREANCACNTPIL